MYDDLAADAGLCERGPLTRQVGWRSTSARSCGGRSPTSLSEYAVDAALIPELARGPSAVDGEVQPAAGDGGGV